MAKKQKKQKTQKEINLEQLQAGAQLIKAHPLFGGCCYSLHITDRNTLGNHTMCIVNFDGRIFVNSDLSYSPKQWAYMIAHNLLHLAFGHFDADKMPGFMLQDADGISHKKVDFNHQLWNMACDIYVNKFLSDIKFGQTIHADVATLYNGSLDDEVKIYDALLANDIAGTSNPFGTAGIGVCDMKGLDHPIIYDETKGQFNRYTKAFSFSLAHSVSKAVSEAGGHSYENADRNTPCQKAARWFIDHYPLLGGLASHFKIIEDYQYCNQHDIQIAAIDVTLGELYLNPTATFSYEEWKFVLAHEYLHAGLMHHARCSGRDHYLWNVACDFVINGWLHELQVGVMPADGLLYDAELKGLSAESIYDLLLSDMKKYAKLNTLRGYHKGDIMRTSPGTIKDGVSLDDFCRSAMQQGLEYHVSTGRGLIPAGLIVEIRALSMPPIPWDVALAKWFDIYFAPLEKHRNYSRSILSQSGTPEIPELS